jgi:hypothetical protein
MPLRLHLFWFGGRFEQVGSVFVALAGQPVAHIKTRVLYAREALAALAMNPTTISHFCAYNLSAAFRAGVSIAFLASFAIPVIERQMLADDYNSPRARPACMLPSRYISDGHRFFFQRLLWAC